MVARDSWMVAINLVVMKNHVLLKSESYHAVTDAMLQLLL